MLVSLFSKYELLLWCLFSHSQLAKSLPRQLPNINYCAKSYLSGSPGGLRQRLLSSPGAHLFPQTLEHRPRCCFRQMAEGRLHGRSGRTEKCKDRIINLSTRTSPYEYVCMYVQCVCVCRVMEVLSIIPRCKCFCIVDVELL